MSSCEQKRVAVIGAGIAGLSAAFYLNKAGFEVRVYEKDDRAGGMIRTSLRDEKYIIEHGPNTFLSSSEHIASLSRELSLDGMELHNNSKERFIFFNGKMRQLPLGPFSFLASGLMSPLGKIRLLAEPVVRSKSPEGETLADFVKRRAGHEVLETLVDPFVSGVWAGDAEQLELQAVLPKLHFIEQKYGSVMMGLGKEKGMVGGHSMVSYRWGMGTLPARLEEVLRNRIRFSTEIDQILMDGDQRIFLVTGNPPRRLEVDAVVVAAGPHAASRLVRDIMPRVASILEGIQYASLSVVHTAFKKSDIRRELKGFGVLVPRSQNIRILGTIFSSALFENRSPRDEVLLTTFIGGATDPEAMRLSEAEIITEARRGLLSTMGINAKPRFVKVTRYEQAIPQYTVGHTQKIETVLSDMKQVPGIYFTGNYFKGISVSDTIGHARSTAGSVRHWLSQPKIKRVTSS